MGTASLPRMMARRGFGPWASHESCPVRVQKVTAASRKVLRGEHKLAPLALTMAESGLMSLGTRPTWET